MDSGYAGKHGYLGPHKRHKYHLKEFDDRPTQGPNKVFNFHHASLRNVVERLFGVVKARWHMLKGVPHYPREKQDNIIKAGFALHNYLKINEVTKPLHPLSPLLMQWLAASTNDSMDNMRMWITLELTNLGYR